METAYEDDFDSNKQGKPGLKKLLTSGSVFSDLKKIDIQEQFVD